MDAMSFTKFELCFYGTILIAGISLFFLPLKVSLVICLIMIAIQLMLNYMYFKKQESSSEWVHGVAGACFIACAFFVVNEFDKFQLISIFIGASLIIRTALALFVQGEKAEITDQLKEVHQEIGKKERELQAQSNTIQNLSNKIQEQESMIKRILSEQDKFILESEILRKKTEKNTNLGNNMISNKKIHAKLLDALNKAKYEVDIMSPWVNRKIVNSYFISCVEGLIDRGAILKIVYGIANSYSQNNMKDRQEESESILKELQEKFGEDKIRVKYFSSHSKLFICDNDYYVITSCNPLSNAGTNWEEIGEISSYQKNLKMYREKYFNF